MFSFPDLAGAEVVSQHSVVTYGLAISDLHIWSLSLPLGQLLTGERLTKSGKATNPDFHCLGIVQLSP